MSDIGNPFDAQGADQVPTGGTVVNFDISAFRATVDAFGGIARPSLFRAEIVIPSYLRNFDMSTEALTFWCMATTIPGVRIASRQVQRYGIGPLEKMPVGFEFDDIQLVFLGDMNCNILNFFKDWTRSVIEYSSEGVPSSIPNSPNFGMPTAKPYYLNYKTNYQTQVGVATFDSTGLDRTYNMELLGAFPIDIGDVILNWGAIDQVMQIPVRMSFIDAAFVFDQVRFETPSALLFQEFFTAGDSFQSLSSQFLDQIAGDIQGLGDLLGG